MPNIGTGQNNVSVDQNTGKSFGALPDLSVNGDTSLGQIQQNYQQIGSNYNQMAQAAANDVGARQQSLVGNNFGATNPYMYNTYYEPGASSLSSKMRAEGTQQAFEVGMDRGKAAAEKAVEDSKKNYSNAVDAYNNLVSSYQQQLENTYKNPTIAEFSNELLGGNTQTSELMAYATAQDMTLDELKGHLVNGGTNYSLVKDWGEVGKSERRTAATNATLAQFGYTRNEYDKWEKEKQDEFWGRADVGNYWSKLYADSYIKDNYSADTYAKYQDDYNKTVAAIETTYNYITGAIDNLIDVEKDNMSLGYIDLELLSPAVEKVSSTDNDLFYKMWRDELTTDDGEHIPRDDLFKKYITDQKEQELVKKVYQEYSTSTKSSALNDDNETNNAPGDAIQKASDIIAMRVFGRKLERTDDAKLGAESIKINIDDFMKQYLGIDMTSIRYLRNMQNTNEAQYKALVNQAASVYAGANALDIADGEKWYKTANGYEQLPAGTAVMYTLPGTTNADGEIIDEDLKQYMSIVKDINDSSYSEEHRNELIKEAQKSYDAYTRHLIAALQWEDKIESATTPDAYAAILYHSDPSKYKDLIVNGKPISAIIEEWNNFAKGNPEAAYQKMGDIVRYTYQNIGSYWAATPQFMGDTVSEQLELQTEDGRELLPGTGKESDWMPEEDASVLFMILSTSMNQFNSGKEEGNINPNTFMTADGSGPLMDLVVKVGQEVETFFNMASAAIESVFKAGTNVFTGDWEHTFDAKAVSFQQLLDVLSGQWNKVPEDDTSLSEIFSGELNENSWSYLHDMHRDQRENLADVMNPLILGELDQSVGIGINQTSRGVGFWANPTAMTNMVTSVAAMVAGNVVEAAVEEAASTAIKSSVAAVSDSLLRKFSGAALKNFSNNFDDIVVNAALRRVDDLNIDDIVNHNIIHLTSTGDAAEFSFEYTDDFVRGVSSMVNATDDSYDDIAKGFSKVFKQELDNADGAYGAATKNVLEMAGVSADDVSYFAGRNIAREVYQNLQISSFTGRSASELVNLPGNVKEFISKAISANVSRDAVEASVLTGTGNISTLQMMTGNGTKAALEYVTNMSRAGMKNTVNQLIDQAQSFARAGVAWTSDDTLRFLARNGWDSGRAAILRKEWIINQAQLHGENALFNWTIPEFYHGEVARETPEEYFSNPMNYIIPGAASFSIMSARKLFNRANLAVTSKALEKAMNEWDAAGDGMGEEAVASLKKIQTLETKLTRLSNQALDSGRSYDEIQRYTQQANDAALAAQREIESSAFWDIIKSNGKTEAKNKQELFKAINDGKVSSEDLLFMGGRIANAKAANGYYGNATALGRYNGGLASIEDTKTNIGILRALQDFKKSHRFTEIKNMDLDFWEKQKLMYKEMTAFAVNKYGKAVIGLENNLNEFFDRLIASGKEAVDAGDMNLEHVRLGYLPIQSIMNTDMDGPTALRNLMVAGSVLDPSSSNPYLSRGIDYDSILEALEAGKTETTLRDMKGKTIMDGKEEAIFQLNAKGTNFLDQLTCYQNAFIGHHFNDPIFGKNDAHLAEALLKNKSILIKGKDAKSAAIANDMEEINEELSNIGARMDEVIQEEYGSDMTFQKLVDQESSKSADAAEVNVAADEARTKKIAELSAKKADLENRIKNAGNSTPSVSDDTMPARILKSNDVADSLRRWDDAQSEFLELVEAYKIGHGIKIGENIDLSDIDGKNHSFPMTDALKNAVSEYSKNGREIPRDAVVYLMMGKKYTPAWTLGNNGKRIFEAKKTDTKKLKTEYSQWASQNTAWKDNKGWKLSRGSLNKVKFANDDGSLNTAALEKVFKVIEKDVRSKYPSGDSGNRIVTSLKNYVATMARDMDAASLTADEIFEIYDRVAPDLELVALANKTGLFQQLNSLENIGYTLPDLSAHLDILVAKAEVTGGEDLESLIAAKRLVDMMISHSERPKATAGFEVREYNDYGDEDINNIGYNDFDGIDEGSSMSDIFGRQMDNEWGEDYDMTTSSLETMGEGWHTPDVYDADGNLKKPTLESKIATAEKNRMGAVPAEYITWDDSPLFTREEAVDGINALNKILTAMRDPRNKYYDAYASKSLTEMSDIYSKSLNESKKMFKRFNDIVKEEYDKGNKTIVAMVDKERAERKARQAAGGKNVDEESTYDYLAAFDVARPGKGYKKTTNSGELAKASMAEIGVGDVQNSTFSRKYSQIRMQASTLRGQLTQLKNAYDKFSSITRIDSAKVDKANEAELVKINALIAKQPSTQSAAYDSLDTYENSLAFTLGDVEDVNRMKVPTNGEYFTPSQQAGKAGLFTPWQIKSSLWGPTSGRNVMGDTKVTFEIQQNLRGMPSRRYKVGADKTLLIEAGYDNSGAFDVSIYDKDTMKVIDVTEDGGLSDTARKAVIGKVNESLAERTDLAANNVRLDENGKVLYSERDDTSPSAVREGQFEVSYNADDNSTFGNSNDLDYEYSRYLQSKESLGQIQEKVVSDTRAKEVDSLKKELSNVDKELAGAKKNVYKEVKQTPVDKIEDNLAKKYLSKSDYDNYRKLSELKNSKNDADMYDSSSGATFVDDTNGLENYVTLTSFKELMGWKPNEKQLTIEEVTADKNLSKADKKELKQMKKEMNKQIRKGSTFYRSAEEFGLPEHMDHRSKGASLDMYLKLEKQIQEMLGGEVSSDSIYISKDMGRLLAKVSEESLTPGKFAKLVGGISAFNKWVQDQQLAGGVSFVNAMTITQVRDAIIRNPRFAVEYVKACADMKNPASIRNFAQVNNAKLTKIALATGDMSPINDLLGTVSKRPGIDDGGILQTVVTNALNESAENWKGPKSVIKSINNYIGKVFTDPTFSGAIPVLRAKMLVLEYDNAMRVLKESFKGNTSKLSEQAAKMAYARTELFFNPGRSLAKGGFEGFMDVNDIRLYNDQMNRLVGIKKTKTFMDAAANVFFAMRYKMMLSGRVYTGALGVIEDVKSIGRQKGLEMTAENFNKVGTQFMLQGNANGLYMMAALAGVAAVSCIALGIPTAYDDTDFINPIDGEFQVPPILQKFQTIGQIWLPNAYNPETGFYVDASKPLYGIDSMSSTFTLQNSIAKTFDRIFNDNAYAKTPQRGLPFIGSQNPINKVMNSSVSKALGDELLSSNLLSPYRAMYEVLMDTTYFGNNIWEKKYLPDGSENKNYDPMRNINASFMHIIGLDGWLDGGKGYNDYVKGKLTGDYVAQDRIGTVAGSGILQHEYVTGLLNFLDGDYLEGTIEAGELPLKSKNLSSQARTEFNNTVKNTIAQYMSEYQYRTKNATNDEKDAIYADVVKKCADVVSRWSAKWGYVFGDDQSLVPFATRTLMAMTAGEYDDNLGYLQNAIWKAEDIANIEHGSWSWLSDEDLEQWIADGHTVEEFNAEKQRRTDAYNKALDDEYLAREALRKAGYSEKMLEPYIVDDLRAESRNVNKKVFTGILKKLDSPVGEFKNFKEMKTYYETQIDAATTTKAKAKLANQYNTYVTDIIAPYANEKTGYGAAILNDGYYQGRGLANTLAEYIILPADKYYRGKSPRASYLKDLFGVGYKDRSKLPSDEEVIEMFASARNQIQKGSTASAISILDREIEQIKKGRIYASDADYSKIVRLRALLGARS